MKDVKDGGVGLVRLDNIVGWRSHNSCTEINIMDGLEQVLGRKKLTNGSL